MADLDSIYDILRTQGEMLARIDENQRNTRERLFGGDGQLGALHFLQTEISDVSTIVKKHGDQIGFWRGAIAVITVVFTSAMAWAGVILSKHR